ncbi:MAG: hypothetical protein ISR96_01155 [Nitrospira sp.]|nr:hypothetical protein [bacterium]MBL7048122.1 hypothetical protein [Nitrospira sp.]
MKDNVTVLKPCNFRKGQKIRIDGGKRGGDWEVIDVSETKISLKCPVSHREFTWDRFCYFVEEKENESWPAG